MGVILVGSGPDRDRGPSGEWSGWVVVLVGSGIMDSGPGG